MTEFNQVFDGDLAEQAFFIISAVFAVLYAGAVIVMCRTDAAPRQVALRDRAAMVALCLASALPAAVGIGELFSL